MDLLHLHPYVFYSFCSLNHCIYTNQFQLHIRENVIYIVNYYYPFFFILFYNKYNLRNVITENVKYTLIFQRKY